MEVIEQNGYTFPVIVDEQGTLAGQLKVKSIPRTFVVDRNRKIAAVYIGYHLDMLDVLTKQINRLRPEE